MERGCERRRGRGKETDFNYPPVFAAAAGIVLVQPKQLYWKSGKEGGFSVSPDMCTVGPGCDGTTHGKGALARALASRRSSPAVRLECALSLQALGREYLESPNMNQLPSVN